MAQTRNRSMSKRRRLLKSFFFSSSARLVVCSTGPKATSAIKGLQGDQEQLWPDRTFAATTVGRANASSSRRRGGWPLDEFNDVPVRVSDVAAGHTIPWATWVMQEHRVARYLARLRALDTFQRGVEVIYPQRYVGPAGDAAPGLDRLASWADVPDQLDDPAVASAEVCDLYLDRVLAN